MSRNSTYIVFGEQVEGAKHLVVFDLKRPCGLEVSSEVLLYRSLDSCLLLHLQSSNLLLLVAVMVACRPG